MMSVPGLAQFLAHRSHAVAVGYYLSKEKPSSQNKTQTEGRNLGKFPVAAVANYHKLSGSQQHKSIVPSFWRSVV